MSDYNTNELNFSFKRMKNVVEKRIADYRKDSENQNKILQEVDNIIKKNAELIKNSPRLEDDVPDFVKNHASDNGQTVAELLTPDLRDKSKKISTETEKKGEKPKSIPIDLLNKKKIKNLSETLKSRVFGQDSTINDVVNVLKIATLKMKINTEKPAGCYFFAGPSGVGKTELAVALSEMLGDNITTVEDKVETTKHIAAPLLKINMGEYALEQDVNKLIGVAPGYVGYKDGGTLTNFVKENPSCIILFDEIEKAHPSMDNILLSIMDSGSCNSNTGEIISFKNTIVICTSNLGSQVEYYPDLTKEEKDELRMGFIKNGLRPEIINRYDSIFHFNPLTTDIYKKVAQKFLTKLSNVILEQHNFELKYSPKLVDFMVEKSFDPAMGGRPARRFIEKIIVQKLADYMLEDDFEVIAKEQKEIILDLNKDNNVCFKGKNRKILGILDNTQELVSEFESAKFTKKSTIKM